MKQILINKTHDITEFASKDASRYVLNSVHYNQQAKCLEAVDEIILIRVPVVEVDGEFPPVKTAGDKEPIDCIIPLAPLKKALGNIPKSNLPVLGHVKLDSNGAIALTTTDLDTEQAVTCKPIDANYPKCDSVIPTDPAVFKIRVAATVLKRLADYALRHAIDENQTITFEFTGPDKATRFTVPIETMSGKTEASGVFMPVKIG